MIWFVKKNSVFARDKCVVYQFNDMNNNTSQYCLMMFKI